MTRRFALVIVTLAFVVAARGASAAELVRTVRYKLSAGDLASGIAAVEDYKITKGVDPEYLDAVGWLARGAEMLRRSDLAERYVAELRREIQAEKPELIVPLGAAIEVEAKLLTAREGRGAAIRFLYAELARAQAIPLRSRIYKNIDLLSLEGQPAPPLAASDSIGALPASLDSLRGKPVLLFFWAPWCGDCKAQSASLARVWRKYKAQGLELIAATRLYGTVDDKPASPAEEKAQIERVWKDVYSGLDGASVLISTDSMERYGVSATPTFALVDRKGLVRLYTPTRLSEAELTRRIDEVLAEAP